MHTTRWGKLLGAAVVCSLLGLVPSVSSAQPFDPSIDLQLFDYAPGPKSFITVGDGDVAADDVYSFDFLLSFMTDPFTVLNVDENTDEIIGTRTNVVENMFTGEIVGAYGFGGKFQLGASVPLVFSMRGEGLDVATGLMDPGGLQATGIGDLFVELKMRAWQNRDRSLRLAAAGGLSLPTSIGTEGNDFLGDNLPDVRLRGYAQWTHPDGKFTAGGTFGFIFRKPRTIYASEIGQQITYGGSTAYKINQRVSVIGELFGRGDLFSFDLEGSPLEVIGGARLGITKSVSLLIGGGAGLVESIGAPGLRAFAAVGYAPDLRDEDGDGIPNLKDACPLVPEDMDNWEDSDGCPDNDNDGDKREDSVDKCPNKTEDLDGFEDDDGCPELDNDKDGIRDFDDRCPDKPEDGAKPWEKDGCPADARDSDDDGISDKFDQCPEDQEDADNFEDWDGCPDLDNDKDGVPDETDRCPLCMEDKDGFEDADGCPELDNDKDGFLDTQDKCPDAAENINGVNDFDGCPDTGGTQVARLEGDRVQLDRMPKFGRRGTLKSQKDVDQIAAIMVQHPEIVKWRVVVSAKIKRKKEERARASAQARADAIKSHLVGRGIRGEAVEAVGAASDRELVAVVVLERTEVAAEEDDMATTCPAHLRAVERQKPDGSTPAPTAAAIPPPDADGDDDGVIDSADRCPSEAGPVENGGCPDTDRDGDGVVDRLDNCPDVAGKAKRQGCKKRQLVVIKQNKLEILDKVYFASGKDKIRRRSYKLLRNVGSVLGSHPEIPKIRVEGHTDDQGDDQSNKDLSQRRADSVVQFLVKEGIAIDRLEAVGYGEEVPIEDNSSRKGRAANRRVEFVIATTQTKTVREVEDDPKAAEPVERLSRVPDEFMQYQGARNDIRMRRNRAKISKGKKVLDKVAALLKKNPGVILQIGAHTDNRKAADKSKEISQSQAETLVEYLVGKGVDPTQLIAQGYGFEEPLADNDSSAGRSQNRRIEFIFSVK